MPRTDDENLLLLQEARDNVIVLIGQVTSKPKPNYDIDGQKILWADYLETLQKSLKSLSDQLIMLGAPVEEESQGYT